MSYVKSESGAKKRKIDSESGLSTKEFKEMYSLDEDGLEIVDMDEDSVESAQEEKVDDDVVMIGNGPEVSEFPHSRHDCLIHPIQNRTKTFKKTKFCVNCYCFVCDVKVAECKHWNDHCMATNTSYWQGERTRMQIQKRIGKTGIKDLCVRCEGTGKSQWSDCSECKGTGVLVRCPFPINSFVTCKVHSGPIPKGVKAVVTGTRLIKSTNDDGEDIAMQVPQLRWQYENCNTFYVSLDSKDEMKKLTALGRSFTSHSSRFSGWPIAFPFKGPTNVEVKNQKDLVFNNRTYKKDWVSRFSGSKYSMKWSRRCLDENGDVFPNGSSRPYCWHISTKMHIPSGVVVRSKHGGYGSNDTVFSIPVDLLKKSAKPLKGLVVPSSIKLGQNVRRSRDPRHDCLKVPNRSNKKWFPDDAVGSVTEIYFDSGVTKFQVLVYFMCNNSNQRRLFPQSMRFDLDELEITSQACKSPEIGLKASTLSGSGSYARDLSASRVKVKKGSFTAKNTQFKTNMIGLVRNIKFEWSSWIAGQSVPGGFFARVEIPFLPDYWYPCGDLQKVKELAIKGPKLKYKWYAGDYKNISTNAYSKKFRTHPKFNESETLPILVDKDQTPNKWHLAQTLTFDFEILPMGRNGYHLPTKVSFQSSCSSWSDRRCHKPEAWKKMACTGDIDAYKNALNNGLFTFQDLSWLEAPTNDNDIRPGFSNIRIKSIDKDDVQKIRQARIIAHRSCPNKYIYGLSGVKNRDKEWFCKIELLYELCKLEVKEAKDDPVRLQKAQTELMHVQVARSRLLVDKKNWFATQWIEYCDKYRENKQCNDKEMKDLIKFTFMELKSIKNLKESAKFSFPFEVNVQFDCDTSKMTLSFYVANVVGNSRGSFSTEHYDLPSGILSFYSIMFPPKQFPDVWKSIRELRDLNNEYNATFNVDARDFLDTWDPVGEEDPKSTYLTDKVFAAEKRKRNSPNDKSKKFIENSSEINAALKNLLRVPQKETSERHKNMQSIGGILKDSRNSGRAMALQPVGFVQGTVMRDYQKMSLSFLLDLELGKSTGIYRLVKLAKSGTVLQYFPAVDLWRVMRKNSSWSLGERRGGMLCDEMGLGKTVVSLALIMANPPPDSEFEKRLLGMKSSSNVDDVIIEEVDEEEKKITKMDDDDENDEDATVVTKMDVDEDEKIITKSEVKEHRDTFKKLKRDLKADRAKRLKSLKEIRDRIKSEKLNESGGEIEAVDLLKKYVVGLQVEKMFKGYGTKKWKGVVTNPLIPSNAKKNPKYEIEWIDDNSVTDLTVTNILKFAVCEDVESRKKLSAVRVIVGLINNKIPDDDICVCLFCEKKCEEDVYCNTCSRYYHAACLGVKKGKISTCIRCESAKLIGEPIGEEQENTQKRRTRVTKKKPMSPNDSTLALRCALFAVDAAEDALQYAYEARIAVAKTVFELAVSKLSNSSNSSTKKKKSIKKKKESIKKKKKSSKKKKKSSKKKTATTTNETTKWIQGKKMKSRFMGGTLVVCALSLVGQWQEEAKKFCSDKIKICAYHGGNRIRDPKRLSEYDIVVTTYQTLGADIFAKARRNKKKIKAGLFDEYVNPNDLIELARKGKLSTSPCHSVAWYRVIVDESHLIKNPTARMSLATTSLYSKHSLLVTGTPINSSVQDLAGQMKVFQIHDTVALKGLVDTEMCSKFFQRKSSSSDVPVSLVYLLRRLMIRHEKDQKMYGKTLLVLPPKTESVKLIEWPDAKTKNLYLEEEKKAKEMFLNIAKKHLVNRNTIRLFGALLPVRLFCSLGCAGESSSSSSADSYFCDGCYGRYLSKQMDKLTCGHIFCQKRCMELVEADKKCLKCDAVLQADEIVPYNMDLAKSSSASSSSSLSKSINSKITGVKIKLLIKELAELRQKDKTAKVLIFSQFVKTLDQAKIELEKAGLKYRTLTGDMSLSKRKKALSMFQNDPPTTVFLLSIRAGAVGINLTQANFIVLLDACTNPALEAQAIGRVWRLGQKRKVHIRRYIMNNSIETRILDMEAEKNRKREEQEEEEDEEEETKKDEEGKDSSSSNSTTTTSTTNGSSNNNNKKKKKKGSQNDPICIGFAETAVAGSIMSSTQRFRVNEFVKLFGVKDSELPEFYKNQEEDKKNKKKNTTISKKRKASASSNQSSSSSSSKRKRFDLEKENDEDDCVIS